MTETMHKFESSGLGKAPFRCVGLEARVGPYRFTDPKSGVTIEVGSPGQPMGVCDYCGTGIKDCYLIESSDGKRFVVGCECVRKTGDSGLKRVVDEMVRQKNADKRAAKSRAEADELKSLLADDSTRAALAAKPHPYEWASAQGKTWLDYAEWMWQRAGASGRKSVLRFIKSLSPSLQPKTA